uniref:Uncharacterized protein n=1 Tax=Rhipicephalus zambeziensis TaxID=60191 RepID=A0A224YKX8_9ACAR
MYEKLHPAGVFTRHQGSHDTTSSTRLRVYYSASRKETGSIAQCDRKEGRKKSSMPGIGRQNLWSSLRITHEIYFALRAHSDSDSPKFFSAGLTRTHTHQNFLQPDSLGLKLTKTLLTRTHSDSDSRLNLSLSESE